MSNLLSQASLVMIPSGYKEDIVYSQIPTNGNGDLTFTRASNGTRINSSGLVEVCPWNLLTYSEEFDNANWQKYQSTISANATTSPDGTNNADRVVENSASGLHYVSQLAGSAGTYTLSVYAKADTRDWIYLTTYDGVADRGAFFNVSTGVVGNIDTGVTASIQSVGNGWYRCIVTATPVANFSSSVQLATANGTRSYTGNGTSGLFIWGAQLNTGTLKPYFPTTDRLNVPRLTYQNGGGGCPSLLLEKQSTNYALSSEDFANTTYWTAFGSMTVTANQATSPDGTQNADLLYDMGTRQKFVNSPVSSYYTFSCYFKRVDVQTVKISASDGATGDVDASFDLINLTSSSAIAGGWSNNTTKIESVGNGWYRCSVTALRGASGSQIGYRVQCSETAKSFYAWGYQAEASSYPTTYIPTTSSSATRVADACLKTGISSLIGQTEGTLFAEIRIESGSTEFRVISINDGTTSNRVALAINGQTDIRGFSVYGSTVGTAITTSIPSGAIKIAIVYTATNYTFFVNGSKIGTQTKGSFATTLTNLSFDQGNGGNSFFGQDKQLILFPTPLTDAECQALTTI